jgi:hypothetical protein
MQFAEGGGCLSFFGLPFFAAGCFLLLASLKVIPFENADEIPFWGYLVIGLMSVPFAGIGGWLLFGRKWVIFDRSLDLVQVRYGWIVPMFKKEFKINEFRTVVLRLDSGGSDSVDTYPVVLKSDLGKNDLTVGSSTDFGRSYGLAVELAKFLGLSLQDQTSAKVKTLEAESAGSMFLEQIGKGPAVAEVAFMPGMRTELTEDGEHIRFSIRPPRIRPIMFLPLIIPVGILVFIGPQFLEFFQQTKTPLLVRQFFIGFALLIFLFFPLVEIVGALIKNRKNREVITVGSEAIELDMKGAGKIVPVNIPLKDVIDIDNGTIGSILNEVRNDVASGERSGLYAAPADPRTEKIIRVLKPLARSKGITIKARSGIYTFGAGLPDEELNAIYSKLINKLRRP